MATNVLYEPILNPLKFQPLNPQVIPQYVSRFMDDWNFRRTIQPWQQPTCFKQVWQRSDAIRLQYTSNFLPITLKLRDRDGIVVLTQSFITKQQNELQPTFYIRQVDIDLAPFPAGFYFWERIAAGVSTFTDPFELVEGPDTDALYLEDPNPTLYLEYSHYEPHGGILFQAPFFPTMRVPGILKYKGTEADDTIYKDQNLSATLLRSVPFRVWTFILGGVGGVPPWLADKVARILGCSSLKIDGRLFTKNEGAKFEAAELEDYPMGGWSIDLVEKLNRDSIITENDIVIPGIAAAALTADLSGFGMNEDGNSYVEIISTQ